MKKFFNYYYRQIIIAIIIISFFISSASIMLWIEGEFVKQWLLKTSVISGILTVVSSIILAKIK